MKRFAAIATALALAAASAQGQELEGRLKRIKETKTFVVGYRESAIPFSYLNQHIPVGFGVDLAMRVADELKKRLDEPNLTVRWNAMTLATRIPLMVTNTIDIECSTTTNTKARQATVGFSNTFFISDEGIATSANSGINDYGDLAGKRVAVATGTTTERSLMALNAEKNLGMTILPQRTNQRAMAALADGRTDAFVAAKPILAGEIVRNPAAQSVRIVGGGRYREAFACMLPKGDGGLKRVVDEVIVALGKSGELAKMHRKWFVDPIPPFERAVGLAMSDEIRELYAAPNDNAFE